MKNLNIVSKELFDKIRGRFPSVTIGDGEGNVTTVPEDARFFEFDYKRAGKSLGSVTLTLDEDSIQVMYTDNFVENEDEMTKNEWFDFLKELRNFSRKRLLRFDTNNINKSNLQKRDYKFLAKNRAGEEPMSESKMYGTSRTSYQDIGNARLTVKHSAPVNQELAGGRTQKINALYIESAEGERFKYPYKHLSGARAMTRHVAEGGTPYDDFGKHITEMSTELYNLKKFKSYMGRSSVMAEGLADYVDAVNERIESVKKTLEKIQKESAYKEAFQGFESVMMEEVPTDVAENWIDQLTIRQFNEELKDVFPYIYKLVSEVSKAKEVSADDILGEDIDKNYTVKKGDTLYSIARKAVKYRLQGMSVADAVEMIADENGIADPSDIQPGMELLIPYVTGAVGGNPETGEPITRGIPPEEMYSPEDLKKLMNQDIHSEEIENAFESMMGQFAEGVEMCPEACCGKPVTECSCGPDCPHCDCYEKNKMNEDEVRGMDGNAIMSWYNKYEDYQSYDAYGLADGFFKFFLDSGIPTDAMEKQECFALIKKFGSEEFMEDPLGAMEKAPKLAPITTAMFEEFKQIAGPDFGEEEVRTASRMLDNIDEDLGEVSSCCEAPIQGEGAHGRCSECGEMASAIPIDGMDENRFSKNDDEHELNKLMRGTQLDPDSTAYLQSPKKKNKKNKQVREGFKKGDTVMVNDERGPGSDFSAPGVIIGLSSKSGKARVRFRNNKTEILPIGMLSPMGEGNEFAQKVQQMKAAGAKKGDKFKTSDGKEHTLEDVTEYVLSMYDRETGQFPKGETAVLTAIEKDYGEQFINPAKQFIEMVNAKFEEFNGYKDPELMDDTDELDDIRRIAGI